MSNEKITLPFSGRIAEKVRPNWGLAKRALKFMPKTDESGNIQDSSGMDEMMTILIAASYKIDGQLLTPEDVDQLDAEDAFALMGGAADFLASAKSASGSLT